MTSTIKADVVTAQTTNGNVTLQGNGSGTVAIGDNTAITGTLSATGAATLSSQDYPTAGGLWSGRSVTINGAMQVSQRGTSESSITTAQYADAPDRWGIQITTAGTWTASQSTTAPDGFSHSYKMDCTTADASLAAGDRLYLYQKIEGQNLQRFAKGSSSAKKYVVSFWVRSTKTGTYICSLWDANNSRQCSQSYSIGSADTWTQISVDFPADTTGAITSDANQGMQLIFYLAAGSTYSSGTLSTTWEASSNANRAVGQVNVADSTSNDFYITGIQMEAGDVATPFEHESYAETLQKCRRYLTRMTATGAAYQAFCGGAYSSSTKAILGLKYPVAMRSNPTVTYSNLTLTDFGANTAPSSTATSYFGTDSANFQLNVSSGGTQYRPVLLIANNNVAAYLQLDAEL